jgi:hypothetical protein|tara:strand:+ start:448 stop:1122 length:675 start_codon:yes stop_codon:yes gene_type:complete
MTKENIPISIFNWGPCVVKCKIKPEYGKLLLSEAKLDTTDYTTKLAGQIEKEKGYSDASKKKLIPILSQYLGVYDQAYQQWTRKPYEKMPEYIMSALWINYQKANEFNPPHDHDGKLSFVVYLQIPDELKKENQAYVGKSCGPGGIQFLYGDGPRECITYMSYFPEELDMFIFPAWLKHWVSPYKSDCTRISVSGNIHDTAPLNNIHKFGPEYIKDRQGRTNKK